MLSSPDKIKSMLETREAAFAHPLTESGRDVINRLRTTIADNYKLWMTGPSTYMALFMYICQSWGYGKSRFLHELTKSGPGVFVTLFQGTIDAALKRPLTNADALEYPLPNNLSSRLAELMVQIEPTEEKKMVILLDFVASIVFTYLRELIDNTLKGISSGKNIESALAEAYLRSGPQYSLQQKDYVLVEAMFEHYKRANSDLKSSDNIKVKHIAVFIKELLNNPEKFIKPANAEQEKDFISVCKLLAKRMQAFPMILGIDNADLLAQLKDVTSYQVIDLDMQGFLKLRQVFACLEPQTPLMCLTTGANVPAAINY